MKIAESHKQYLVITMYEYNPLMFYTNFFGVPYCPLPTDHADSHIHECNRYQRRRAR